MDRLDLTDYPPSLAAIVRQHEDRLSACGIDSTTRAHLSNLGLARVLGASDFVADTLAAQPDCLTPAFVKRLACADATGDVRARIQTALATAADEPGLKQVLRQSRHREMARIAWRDLAGLASLDETLNDLSALADSCIDGALSWLTQRHRERYGQVVDAAGVAQSLVVLGLGKLGANELNFSSDIDLIFTFAPAEAAPGCRLSVEAWFVRLAQQLINVLDEVTCDGFVFRVDMRLRPFGRSGRLALSFSAMEKYYESHGRDWERYALIKARPVAGDLAAGAALLKQLRPFVYRRYLDYNAFESLREMKAMIAREVAFKGLEANIKLGRGGIREVEFIGQVFQLIRGGREAALRVRQIRSVLTVLARDDYLSEPESRALDDAYMFLRRSENRLQMAADQQTHDLPTNATACLRLAWSMGFDDWAAYRYVLERHRTLVRGVFDEVFSAPDEAKDNSDTTSLWQMACADDDNARAALCKLGFESTASDRIRDFYADSSIQALNARGARRLQQLMPRVIQATAASDKPNLALEGVLSLLEAVAGRTTYLALLQENEWVLKHLATIAAASPWLLDIVTRVPILMDELIDPRVFQAEADVDHLAKELMSVLAGVAPRDQEAEMDALRQFQQAVVLRVAVADISGGHSAALQVSQRLTSLAVVVLREVFELTFERLAARHGAPVSSHKSSDSKPQFAVIAYGSLGSGELGYGSDLDLVFIYDGTQGQGATNGPRPIDGRVFYTRWSQRLISFLSTPTRAGVLYRTDTRLRPSGSSGLLVSGFDGFARYQRNDAWTWEHQALIRARPVAGDDRLAARFNALRKEILCRERDPATLARDIVAMRERMREAQAVKTHAGFDIKQDVGGLIDIEFLCQYWVLRDAHAYPSLIDAYGHCQMLTTLADKGLIEAHAAHTLAHAYRCYMARAQRSKLEGWQAIVPDAQWRELRDVVSAYWHETFS